MQKRKEKKGSIPGKKKKEKTGGPSKKSARPILKGGKKNVFVVRERVPEPSLRRKVGLLQQKGGGKWAVSLSLLP